ncbi:MAG: Sugar phosphate isomerase/epimerase [Verrucomicrobia bacterium]|nr:MAG: Sugar phosphate isomerase/epimerase [Verrucomicrobiota bacterium]
MKVGIDSYCYHRQFGEVYPGQASPEAPLTFENFMLSLEGLGIDGVSLESCFIPRFDASYLAGIKAHLDALGMDRVYAWGHPDGLEAGQNESAYAEMIGHMEHAKAIGASVMRVVGSSLRYRAEPHGPQLEKLTRMFSDASALAAKVGVKLALENHIDYNSNEILQLLKDVDSPHLGVNFDSGNFLRVLDDPVEAMRKLAPHVLATHIKDLRPVKGVPADAWHFFSCVPTGDGLIQNEALARILSENRYTGFLAVEIDFLHPDYQGREDWVVRESIRALKAIAANL